jgi:hypothetical protein
VASFIATRAFQPFLLAAVIHDGDTPNYRTIAMTRDIEELHETN